MDGIQRMDHFTVVTDRLDETCAFHARLGLVDGVRPDFGVDGRWLYAEGHPVLHLVAVGTMPMPRRGALDHMAFFARGLATTLQLLRREGIAYRLLRQPRPWSTWQVFFSDPSGVEVELDFDAAETIPPALKNGQPGG
ncbi:dioxygenase [Pseudorhodoferax sp. LjRoot39]|uniref:VOC family protein n=1 Tax=Pseudorhodoferax sp. LjRoot39 TaxID=3342328 RepID=UPI003ECC96F6